MKKIIFAVAFAAVSAMVQAEKISVALNPGPVFKSRAPQIAVWIEDEKGNFMGTVFVTRKAASNGWIMSPKDGRPESLPDWYKAKNQNPAEKISRENLDAMTSATPKKGIVAVKDFSLEKGKNYVVKCQANQSFDYNNVYTKKNSGVDGQPAVIYEGKFLHKEELYEIELEYSEKNEGITTAKEILGKIYVAVN